MNQVVDTVRQELLEAIEADRLVLPTLPEVALKVREIAEDSDAGINDLAKVIGNDAAIAARIIKVANSPLLRGAKEIEDLKMALMRLGMEYTCSIAIGLAMEQMFQATSDMVDKRMREIWSRSTEIAGICHLLCKHCTKLRPDQATLAGLVHKIGALPILSYAEEHPALLKDSITLDRVIEALHGEVGDMILERWQFPEEIRKVPSQHVDFYRQQEKADYADIVTVALLQSYMGSENELANIDYAAVTAFARLGLDPDMREEEGEDLSAEMEAAMQMLG
ncbi:MAG: HDOD domain-containing protein [Gammaproteobacteria bacterium]|uniref:HDOD domain-containing protein n=1 Tax=Pseudomaricurvus alcaniphilus TaxID=1166482 RepID=UPI00140E18AE|nr:HDOD domain-containing protein [Pseudomaricurvus alcaniphilus]MBR9911680.1 HDOD domain-containing protein [Gammaproteobacteria bacterium]NHN39375.1 HDOD domain-containing protein [Pseudomaricurvus alcaniphilus]